MSSLPRAPASPAAPDKVRRRRDVGDLQRRVSGVLASVALVAPVTGAIELLKPHVPVLSLGVLDLFAVLPVAVVWGLAYAIPVSIASMALYNFLFLPPLHTLTPADSRNWFALAVFLVTAVVVSELAARSPLPPSAPIAQLRPRARAVHAWASRPDRARRRPPHRPRRRRDTRARLADRHPHAVRARRADEPGSLDGHPAPRSRRACGFASRHPLDARVESGRTPIHALERLWNVEHFGRIVIPAPTGREPGFAPKELLWMLTHAPSETVILRPDPALRETAQGATPPALEQQVRRRAGAAERMAPVPATQVR